MNAVNMNAELTEDQVRRLWRRVHKAWVLRNTRPPDNNVNHGTVGNSISSNGGCLSDRLADFIIICIIGLHSADTDRIPFFDLGSGMGTMNMAAAANSRVPRLNIGIDMRPDMHQYSLEWRTSSAARIVEALGDDAGGFVVEQFLPRFVPGDFLRNGDLRHVLQRDVVIIFCNNAEDCWVRGDGPQPLLEKMLTDDCRPGTRVVCLSRSFLGNLMWREVITSTTIERSDLSWTASGSPKRREEFQIYEYTKTDAEVPRETRGRTKRVEVTSRFRFWKW